MTTDIWIILTASLVSTCCAILGCYLILRRMAMIGDAISHAVLPGIVLAFLFTGSRDSVTMLIGAGAVGIFTTFLIEFFNKQAKLQADAAIGVTFTWLFAIGVVLISVFAEQVDLDQDCVLYGELAYVPLDTIQIFSFTNEIPKASVVMFVILLSILLVVRLFGKQLLITSFDPAYASSIGLATTLWHYVLMSMVSATTVASFEAVGAILVVALLIVPAATAYLLTDDFRVMMKLSIALGIFASVLGYYLAYWLDGSIAAAIAIVCGIFFSIALVFSPAHGLVKKHKKIIMH
ncbi:MAG: metal ABC transporter permease [Chryseotalea sp.]